MAREYRVIQYDREPWEATWHVQTYPSREKAQNVLDKWNSLLSKKGQLHIEWRAVSDWKEVKPKKRFNLDDTSQHW